MNLADLHTLGVEVSLGMEGNVRLRAAPGVLTPQLKQAIVEAKPRLIEELRGLRREPVNLVNLVNFDSHCLTPARAPSTASEKVHPASNPQKVNARERPSAPLDSALSSKIHATVMAWLDHIGETDGATIAEVLAACFRGADARDYFMDRSVEAVGRQCANCQHARRPGGVVLYCSAGRADLALAYGDGHPLRQLPENGGASCERWSLW